MDIGAREYAGLSHEMLEIVREHDGAVHLPSMSLPQFNHTMWFCNDLSRDNWEMECVIPSGGAQTSWTDTAPSPRLRFYEVRIMRSEDSPTFP
ncbi:MAG: hypothetical protein Q8Q12_16420 [bacterium]|nr:hypothetical protein [bacterium]